MSEENKNPNIEDENIERTENEATEETVVAEGDIAGVPSEENTTESSVGFGELFDGSQPQPAEKRRAKISLPAFLVSAVAIAVAAVMVTWTVSYNFYRNALNEAISSKPVTNIVVDGAEVEELSDNIDLLKKFFDYYYYYDDDDNKAR